MNVVVAVTKFDRPWNVWVATQQSLFQHYKWVENLKIVELKTYLSKDLLTDHKLSACTHVFELVLHVFFNSFGFIYLFLMAHFLTKNIASNLEILLYILFVFYYYYLKNLKQNNKYFHFFLLILLVLHKSHSYAHSSNELIISLPLVVYARYLRENILAFRWFVYFCFLRTTRITLFIKKL